MFSNKLGQGCPEAAALGPSGYHLLGGEQLFHAGRGKESVAVWGLSHQLGLNHDNPAFNIC